MAYVLSGSQAAALVLFNRFYRIDMDIQNLRVVAGPPLSSHEEMYHGLRWIALLHGKVPVDLVGATGIYDAEDVIKQILAGASTVQLCSTLYRNGLDRIRVILDHLAGWMTEHAYTHIEEFRGLLSQHRSSHPAAYERLQYAAGPLRPG
jgi:dihydroorotate dehydrogenase (fumarate)